MAADTEFAPDIQAEAVQAMREGMGFRAAFLDCGNRRGGGRTILDLSKVESFELTDKGECVVAMHSGARHTFPRTDGRRTFAALQRAFAPVSVVIPAEEEDSDAGQEHAEPSPDDGPARGVASRQPVGGRKQR